MLESKSSSLEKTVERLEAEQVVCNGLLTSTLKELDISHSENASLEIQVKQLIETCRQERAARSSRAASLGATDGAAAERETEAKGKVAQLEQDAETLRAQLKEALEAKEASQQVSSHSQ